MPASPRRTWITDVAQGLAKLKLEASSLRDEMVKARQDMKERHARLDARKASRQGQCHSGHDLQTEVTSARITPPERHIEEEPESESRDQTSEGTSKLGTPVHRCQHDGQVFI